MKQQLEMLADAPPHVDWDREVQELITLLVEAVLTFPEDEKRRLINKSIAPLIEALLALKTEEEIPKIGLIWMSLIICKYLDYARRLRPPSATLSEETVAVPPTSSESKETPDVA
jgi:hypothetical protein